MKKSRLAVAAALLAALAAIKLLLPDVAAAARQKALAVFPDETDYRAVFENLSEWIYAATRGGEASEGPPEPAFLSTPAPTPTPAPAAVAATLEHTGYHVEEAAALGEKTPPEETAPEALVKTEAETETETPAAVAAFLESQAAFSGYALPPNVDYAYPALPFAYAAPVAGYTSSGFGYRLHPILDYVRFHYGTDVAANAGEEVLAFADGTVGLAGESSDYGKYIVVDHGDGWTTLYAHCSALFVTAGQRVSGGERIALVGETGIATGPHLHFELRRDGVYYNPEYYING